MSQKAGLISTEIMCGIEHQNFVFSSETDNMAKLPGEVYTILSGRLLTLHVHQPPAVPGKSSSNPLTLDSGLNQKPHGLQPNTHITRLFGCYHLS
jgi:hypothetical protein